jgi:hypothetical protein
MAHDLRRSSLHVRQEVGIYLLGRPVLSVSQAPLQGMMQYPKVGADRRRAVSSIVQHNNRHAGGEAQLVKPVGEELRLIGSAVLLAEDVLPAPLNKASEVHFGLLAGTVRFK